MKAFSIVFSLYISPSLVSAGPRSTHVGSPGAIPSTKPVRFPPLQNNNWRRRIKSGPRLVGKHLEKKKWTLRIPPQIFTATQITSNDTKSGVGRFCNQFRSIVLFHHLSHPRSPSSHCLAKMKSFLPRPVHLIPIYLFSFHFTSVLRQFGIGPFWCKQMHFDFVFLRLVTF